MTGGQRLSPLVRRALGLAAGAAVCLALVPVQSAAAASTYVTTTDVATAAQIDTNHDGVLLHDTLALPLTQAWNAAFNGSTSYPLIDNGRVFVTAIDSNGSIPQLWALDLKTGSKVWGPISLSGPGWANATLDNGRIFVEDVKGILSAYDENGNKLWTIGLTGPYTFSAPPTALNGIVYTSGAGSGTLSGLLYAIRESDGSTLWTAPVMHGDISSPVVTSTGVYVSYACAQTYDFNPTTGVVIWQHSGSCSAFGGKTPVLANGKLYVRDATVGNVILDAATGATLGTFPGGVTPVISGNRGFFKDANTFPGRAVYGYDLTSNTKLWTFTGDGALTSAPIVVGNFLYVSSSQGTIFAVDTQSGQAVWSAPLGPTCCNPGPNETDNFQPLTGLGAGYGMLFVPILYNLVAFGGQETLYPGNADFGYQPVGQTTSPPLPVTLTSNLPNGLRINSIATTGDYGQSNNCPAALAFSASCVISVTFTPTASASRPGTLTITDNAAGSPHAIQLSGFGTAGNPPDHILLAPASATITAGGSQSYIAEAFDRNNVDLGPVTASTTFTVDGTACPNAVCAATVAGSHAVTGNYGGMTASASLSVTPASATTWTLTPATADILAGGTQAYSFDAYDQYGNAVGPLTSVTLSMAPAGTCASLSCSATQVNRYTVTATASGKTGTAILNVTAGPTAAIHINPRMQTTQAGVGRSYSLYGNDQYGNATFSNAVTGFSLTIGPPDTACVGTTCSETTAGTYTVTATYQGLTTTTQQTVVGGALDHLTVTPAAPTMVAGGSQTYAVEGFDQYGNDLGSATAASTFTITPDGSCTGASCTATIPGTHNVTAVDAGKTATATLTVAPGAVATLSITPSSSTISAAGTTTYTATATDQYGNSLGDVTAATTFTIAPDGSCSTRFCGSTVAGSHTVTASDQGATATAALTVTPGPVTRLTLSPSTAAIVAGGAQSYTAVAFDQYGNSFGDVTATSVFYVDSTLNPPCAGNTCAPTAAGAHQVVGEWKSAGGSSTLTVTAGPLSRITLSPSSATIGAGGNQTYAVEAYDQYNNDLGSQTTVATFAIGPDGTCAASSCGATKAGMHTVTATDGGRTATASLTVNAGSLDHIRLTPASTSITAGGSMAYSVEGFDTYSNDLGTFTANSPIAITPDGACANASCTATRAGAHTVTATSQGKTATASLRVNAGPMSALAVSPPSVTLVVGKTAPLSASATDAYGNAVSSSAATWSLSTGTPGTLSAATGSRTTFVASTTSAGTGTVTAHLGTLTAQTSVRVLPAAPTGLSATAQSGRKITLTWKAAAGDKTFALYRLTGSGAWTLIKAGLTTTTFTDSDLTSGTTYRYYVSGRAAGLESAASNQVTVAAK